MNYTLVVIDMQKTFLEKMNLPDSLEVERRCLQLINNAGKAKSPILFMEYNRCGQTINSLLNKAESITDKVYRKLKWNDNGGAEILRALSKYKLPQHIKVCGINTDACVKASVEGYLSESKYSENIKFKNPSVHVITKACGSAFSHQNGVKNLIKLAQEFPNLKVK